jgi:hypothetical protein
MVTRKERTYLQSNDCVSANVCANISCQHEYDEAHSFGYQKDCQKTFLESFQSLRVLHFIEAFSCL